jgi:methylglutaconyl-CoA hydratase
VTLALVHGVALAGGAGLMMACDFAIATYDAKIGFPEVRRGLVAGLIMTFLRRQLRERDTRELLLGGEIITSERAQELGIVNRVVPKEALMAKAHQIAESVIKGGPEAIALTKQILDELWHRSVQEDLKTALKHHVRARQSKEASEGIQAFLEKRAPEWQ